jgi:NTP pyrophosphatase (non-canonical NTP hydrolase)
MLKADMQAAIEQMGQLLGQVVQMNQKYQDSVERQLASIYKALGEKNGSDIPESSEK